MTTITVFKGDGIGPEITDAVIKVLNAANAKLEYEVFNVGAKVYEETGEYIPEKAFESYEKNKILLKSPITTPVGKGFRSLNVTLRNKYDLWANIRPAKSNPCIPTRFDNVDIVTFRENTEDLYVGKEEQIDENTVYAYKIITKKASTRIIRAAFEYCVKNNRKKLTCVHKANILKMSDGLFLHIFEDISKEYPQIESNSLIVDNTCMQLVMHPEQFDVMVMPNLYGDIVSDLCAGLVGGLGFAPSGNIGDEYRIYEAVHGSAPDIAGQGIANPSALLLAFALMLEALGQNDQATRLRDALSKVVEEGKIVTRDIGGNASTKEFTQAIIDRL